MHMVCRLSLWLLSSPWFCTFSLREFSSITPLDRWANPVAITSRAICGWFLILSLLLGHAWSSPMDSEELQIQIQDMPGLTCRCLILFAATSMVLGRNGSEWWNLCVAFSLLLITFWTFTGMLLRAIWNTSNDFLLFFTIIFVDVHSSRSFTCPIACSLFVQSMTVET